MSNEVVDAPYPYDLKINGHGYVLARGIEPSLPFRTQRARYGYTPTFLERSNISGNLGDNQQAVWSVQSQNDWSLGAGQKFYDQQDTEKARKLYQSFGVDLSQAGNATTLGTPVIAQASNLSSLTFAAANDSLFYSFNGVNLMEFDYTGASTNRGDAGLTVTPTCACSDNDFLYMSGTTAAVVRKYNFGTHAFSAFSATAAESLVYMNNTLYGVKGGVFYTYASSGAATASFTWKDATGATMSGYTSILDQLGGKVLVLRAGPGRSALWEWDGTGMSLLAQFPDNFTAIDLAVTQGIVFVVGFETGGPPGTVARPQQRTAVWFYSGTTIGRTYAGDWQNTVLFSQGTGIAPFGDGFVFVDPCCNGANDTPTGGGFTGAIMEYSISLGAYWAATYQPLTGATGGIVGSTGTRRTTVVANQNGWFVVMDLTIYSTESAFLRPLYPPIDPASAYPPWMILSADDFNSSLTKLFRAVTINHQTDPAATSPGSVDIWYQVDHLGGSSNWTLLQAAAVSGTEYTLPTGTQGKTLQLALKLNRGSKTGPTYYPVTVTRAYVRAIPEQTQFRTAEYVLDLTSWQGKTSTKLNNGQFHPLSGRVQLDQLLTDILSTTPITVIDRIGTFTAIAELDQLDVFELHPEQFYVRFSVKQI